MLIGWFKNQIDESMAGLYSDQLGRSYRQGMSWFIFSEVMFFAAFFGALYYARFIAVPWLGGASNNAMTNEVLWPTFEAMWPLVSTPGGVTTQEMSAAGLPTINTVILLISSITLHFAHVGLEQNKRKAINPYAWHYHLTWVWVLILAGGGICPRVSRLGFNPSVRYLWQYFLYAHWVSRHARHPWNYHSYRDVF